MVATQSAGGVPEPEVVCAVQGCAGLILLNRPRALNALTHGMVREIHAALDAWEGDSRVSHVLIAGAGDRAFCAGGDIRLLHDLGKAGRVDEALAFWRDEYELNIRIKRYPKPYVALVDGIVMGGGVGVSLHGSHVVAGDRYSFAMPEVGIGFFPDVGATHALPRLPGSMGRYLALTGQRLGAPDALAAGLVTATVASTSFAILRERLVGGLSPADALDGLPAADAAPKLGEVDRAVIARCFAGATVETILASLDAAAGAGSAFAAATASTMRAKSPLSLCIALEQMKRGATLGFEDAMRLEFRVVSRMMDNPDFFEGVRAAVIDKDQSPRWSPAQLGEVAPEQVQAFFAPVPAELVADGTLRP